MSRSGTNSLRYNQIRANNLKVKGENMTTSGPVKTNQRNKIQQCRQFYLFNVLGDAKSTQRLYINDRHLWQYSLFTETAKNNSNGSTECHKN